MALKMTLREANIILSNMLERADNTYTAIEAEAIKRLQKDGLRRESYMIKNPWSKSHEMICVVCGKSFMTKKEKTIYCSQTCINKASWERMKNDPERLKKHREYNKEYIKQHKK